MQNLKKLLTDSLTNVETAERAVAEVQASLTHAEAEVSRIQAAYDDGATARVVAGNSIAAAKERKAIADAQSDVGDLRVALKTAKARLQAAQAAVAADELSQAWAKAADLLDARTSAVATLQKLADDLVEQFNRVCSATNAAVAALPRHGDLTNLGPSTLINTLRGRMTAISGGAVGRLGLFGMPITGTPDLVEDARAIAAGLLEQRTFPQPRSAA